MTRKRKATTEASTADIEIEEDYFSVESPRKKVKQQRASNDLAGMGKGKGKGKVGRASKQEFYANIEVGGGGESSFDDIDAEQNPKRIIKRRKKKQKFNCKVCDTKVFKAQKKLFTACAICGDMAHSKCIKDRSKEWICRTCVADASYLNSRPPKKDTSSKTLPRKPNDSVSSAPRYSRRPARGDSSSRIDYSQYTCPRCGLLSCTCTGIFADDFVQDEDDLAIEAMFVTDLSDEGEGEEQEQEQDGDDDEDEQIDILLPLSHNSQRLFIAESEGSETEDVMSIDSQYDSSLESEESSIYEEPETFETEHEEGVMAELVREKLMNGWDEEDSDQYFEEAEDFFDTPASDQDNEAAILETETAAIQADLDHQKRLNMNHLGALRQEESMMCEFESGVSAVSQRIQSSSSGCKKKNVIPVINTSIEKKSGVPLSPFPLSGQSQPSGSNFASQLLAFASLKKAKNTFSSIMPNAADSKVPMGTSPISNSTFNLSKKPVDMTSVVNAAAALMANPAAMKAFSEMRSKKEAEKLSETFSLHAKVRAAAQAAAIRSFSPLATTGSTNGSSFVNDPVLNTVGPLILESNPVDSVHKIFPEQIGSIGGESEEVKEDEIAEVVAEVDDFTLFEDIFDHGRFEEGSRSDIDENSGHFDSNAMENNPHSDFSRFAKIPFGTFWKSQRKGSKGGVNSKKKDLQRAIKKSSNFKILDSTLMENMRTFSKRAAKKSSTAHQFLFSPVLLPFMTSNDLSKCSEGSLPSQSLEFLDVGSLPPPFTL